MPRPRGLGGTAGPSRLLGAAASGALLVLAFPEPDLGWLAWGALVPLLLSIEGLRPRQAFGVGYAAGLVAFGGLMRWIAVFGYPAWLLLSGGMALYMGVFAASARLLGPGRRTAALWSVPLCWVAVEALRSLGPLGFPWGLLGLTQHRSPLVLPVASVGGVLGLSALIAVANALLATTIGILIDARRTKRRDGTPDSPRYGGLVPVAGVAVLAAVLLVAGATLSPPVADRSVTAAAIQPNVSPRRALDGPAASSLLVELQGLTASAAAAGAELIVYPESAVPADLESDEELRRLIAGAARGAVVVAGAHLAGPRNGAVVIGPDGRILGTYAKRRLVPFGEAGLLPGVGSAPTETPVGRLGIAVCYESAFFGDWASAARSGAGLLAVLTNDGWFGGSAGPPQHAAHSVLRAVETGRSVVRAANTGISMIVGPDGSIDRVLPLGASGVIVRAVPVGSRVTFYARAGWLLGPLALAGWFLLLACWAAAEIRRKGRSASALILAAALPAVPLVAERVLAPGPVGALPGPLTSVAMLAACVVTGSGHLFGRRGAAPGGVGAAALVALLVLAMRSAYAGQGFAVPLGPPDGDWILGGAHALLAGVATEAWLRGAVYGHAERIGGWVLGTATSTALGMLLYLGGPQELMFWHLITGAAFGLIRARSRDAVGLGPARGLGDAAVSALAGLR